MRKFFKRFKSNEKAQAAIEFSLLLPMMCALFFGTAEITHGQLIAKKLDKAVRVATDLPGHNSTINGQNELNDIMEAAAQAIAPFNPNEVRFMLAGVVVNPDGSNRVIWSGARGGATPLACGASVIVPQELHPQDQLPKFLVYGEGVYRYVSPTAWFVRDPVDYRSESYWPARHNQEVRFVPPVC